MAPPGSQPHHGQGLDRQQLPQSSTLDPRLGSRMTFEGKDRAGQGSKQEEQERREKARGKIFTVSLKSLSQSSRYTYIAMNVI